MSFTFFGFAPISVAKIRNVFDFCKRLRDFFSKKDKG